MDYVDTLSDKLNAMANTKKPSNGAKEVFSIEKYNSLPEKERPKYVASTMPPSADENPPDWAKVDDRTFRKGNAIIKNPARFVKSTGERLNPEEPTIIESEEPISMEPLDNTAKKVEERFAPEAPVTPPEPPKAPGLSEYDELQRELEGKKPKASFTDFIPALASIATEALMGAGGQMTGLQSFDIGGKYLVDKAKSDQKKSDDLENKLYALKMKRALASSKAFRPDRLRTLEVDVDGKPIITDVNSALGKQAWKKSDAESKGLTFDQRLELQRNAAKLRREIEGNKLAGKKELKLKDLGIDAGRKFQQTLERDKTWIDYNSQLVQSQRALHLLSQGLGVADAGARTTFAKGIFGEVGNLAIQEQMAVSGSPALYQKWQSLWDKATKGTLGDEDRADMVEVAVAIRNHAPTVLRNLAMKRAEAEKNISGVDVTDVAKTLSRDVTTGKIMVDVIYKGRIKRIPIEKYPEAVRTHKVKLFTGKE